MKLLLTLFLIFSYTYSNAQNTGIGTINPHPSAALEIADSSRGILIPRMTMSQRNAIQSPAEGLMVYQTDSIKGYWYFTGNIWTHFLNESNNSIYPVNTSFGGASGCYSLPIAPNQLQNYFSTSDITFNKPIVTYNKFVVNFGHTVNIAPNFGYLIIKADTVIINGKINGKGIWSGIGNGGGASGGYAPLNPNDASCNGIGNHSIIAGGIDTIFSYPKSGSYNGNSPSVYQKNLSIDFRDKLMGASARGYYCGSSGSCMTIPGAKGGGGLIIVCNYFYLSEAVVGHPAAIIDVSGGTQQIGSCSDYYGQAGGGSGCVLICSPKQEIRGTILTIGGIGNSPISGSGGNGWLLSVN